MNISPLIMILLFGHILGDFYFQWTHMAGKKKTCLRWLLFHGVVYAACMMVGLGTLILFGGVAYSHHLLWIFLFVSLSHLAIDFLKRIPAWESFKWSFSIDQAAHLIIIFWAWLFWGREIEISCYIYDFSREITIVLGFLIILGPVGLLVESLNFWAFNTKNPSNSQACKHKQRQNEIQAASQKKISRIIGYLERIIIFFLLLYGEYGAIALVIAAKSIARFPEISNTKSYLQANHYIIGTFLSLVSVILVTVLLGLNP